MEDDELQKGTGDLESEDEEDETGNIKPGNKNGKKTEEEFSGEETESVDDIADKEDDIMPEDSYDDVDLW